MWFYVSGKDELYSFADFGLSEYIYLCHFRQMKEESGIKLPIRWMALESLQDGIDRFDIHPTGHNA